MTQGKLKVKTEISAKELSYYETAVLYVYCILYSVYCTVIRMQQSLMSKKEQNIWYRFIFHLQSITKFPTAIQYTYMYAE